MLFIYRLPFQTTLPEANQFNSNSPWLPIFVRTPPSSVQVIRSSDGLIRAASNSLTRSPKQGWKPTPWLLDTGCTGLGWLHHPGALRQNGLTEEVVNSLRMGLKVSKTKVADGRLVESFPCRLQLWLRSNLLALRNFPFLLRTCTFPDLI
jgi:hypothetical protein